MNKRFNTDTEALKNRLQLNTERARYNLEDWIIRQVDPQPGMRVLDLGCGTGKQIFAVADLVSVDGSILGFDFSQQAVDEVNRRATAENLPQIRAMQGSLDDCMTVFKNQRFDLILSSYAINYAKDMKRLLGELHSLLNADGKVFVCGPGRGTNREIVDLVNQASVNSVLRANNIDDFVPESDITEIGELYSSYRTVRLDNQIRFNSTGEVLKWWKNHNSFIPEAYDFVESAIKARVSKEAGFTVTKNVLGVCFYA